MEQTIRKIRGLLIFYRGFMIPSIIITVISCTTAIMLSVDQLKNHEQFLGIIVYFPLVFWTKTISNILFVYFLLKFKANELYFYYNLGISRTALCAWTFAVDYSVLVLSYYFSGLIVKLIQP
jgi:hypothetical protein